MISITYKAIRKAAFLIIEPFYNPTLKLMFYLNGVKFGKGISAHGFIKVRLTRRGKMQVGSNLNVNSGFNYNVIGRQQKSIYWVDGNLKIGNNVGMSSSAIICNFEIEIKDNVLIGGNTVIYDSDFHSLEVETRNNKNIDKKLARVAKVTINENVFIGAHSTILKGVTIGKNSIVGACSVVTKDIPENQIWAGNPAVFIKKIDV